MVEGRVEVVGKTEVRIEEEETEASREEIDALFQDVLACAGEEGLEFKKEDLKALLLSQQVFAFSPQAVCAEVSGRGYVGFDPDLVARDEAKLIELGSVSALVAYRIEEQRDCDVSVQRIERYDVSGADISRVERLKKHANSGVVMPSPAGFEPNPSRFPSESGLVRSLQLPLIEKIEDKVRRNRAVVVRADMLVGELACRNLNLAQMHVVQKPKGSSYTVRPVVNYVDFKGVGDEMKLRVADAFGEQKLTSVLDKVEMINTALAIAKVTYREVVFNHFDLKDAYDLTRLVPEQAPELAYYVTDPRLGRLIIVPSTPQMGHPASGAAFGDLAHVIAAAVSTATLGIALTKNYMDDFLQASFTGPEIGDQVYREAARITLDIFRGIGGENAVAEDKTVMGVKRVTDCGFDFSVEESGLETVAFSKRGLLKAAIALCSMQEDSELGVTLQRRLQAQSYASRLAILYREVKPLLNTLYSFTKGIVPTDSNRNVRMPIDLPGRACIKTLKAFLIMLILDDGKYSCRCRFLSSFLQKPLAYRIEFDASLEAGGIIISTRGEEDAWTRAFVSTFRFPFSLTHMMESVTPVVAQENGKRQRKKRKAQTKKLNAAFQNVAEFTTGLVGIALLAERGVRDVNVKLVNDSRTALAWLDKCNFRSSLVTPAASVWVRLSMAANVETRENEHVAGTSLTDSCDWLSREGVDDPLARFPHLELWPVQGAVAELLAACDPTLAAPSSTAQIFANWKRYEALVAALCSDRSVLPLAV